MVVKGSWLSSVTKSGEYKRKASKFRNFILKDGDFPPETGRYRLYVSLACPWANRTLILRNLKGLQDVISVCVVDWFLGEGGWRFNNDGSIPFCTPDPEGHEYLREIYFKQDPEYTGNITVPVLYDTKSKTIVNNESSEIIRMLNTEFNEFCKTPEQAKLNLYPTELQKEIDEINELVYHNINNGVYKCGFANSQEAYDKNFDNLFNALDEVEKKLSKSRYLVGDTITEADIRLFVTLARFDMCYVQHFKTNKCRIVDYPNIWGYTKELYQMEGIGETIDEGHIKKHYMGSHKSINPSGIIPKGPFINFMEPHNREHL